MKERIREVEEMLRSQEEVSSDNKTYTQLESAREVNQVFLHTNCFYIHYLALEVLLVRSSQSVQTYRYMW
jgi:hypothetical protein